MGEGPAFVLGETILHIARIAWARQSRDPLCAMSLRHKVNSLLDPTPPSSVGAKAVEALVVTLILLSVTAIVVETVPGMSEEYGLWFRWIERGTLVVFTIEYVLRVWSCTADPAYSIP